MTAPFSNDGVYPVFLAKGLVPADELYLNVGLDGELLGMVAQIIAQGLCPSGVVEQPDLMVTEVTCHGARISDIGKSSGNDDTIEAGKHAGNLILVAFDERIHGSYPLFLLIRIRIDDSTHFGSGYAGLGTWHFNFYADIIKRVLFRLCVINLSIHSTLP